MKTLNAQHLIGMIGAVNRAIAAARDELNALDSALGDGDHGTSLSAAFADAAGKVAALAEPTPSAVLEATGYSLLNRMGGASGALYGTLFLRAGMAVKDKAELAADDVHAMLRAGLEGVMQRGKAQPGDKTMVDALQPAVQVFVAAPGLDEALTQAAAAASTGAQGTRNMVARHGRAKFIGDRSLGHLDAGAQSIAIMFAALDGYWKESQRGKA